MEQFRHKSLLSQPNYWILFGFIFLGQHILYLLSQGLLPGLINALIQHTLKLCSLYTLIE